MARPPMPATVYWAPDRVSRDRSSSGRTQPGERPAGAGNPAPPMPATVYGAPGRIRTCDPRLSLPTTPFDAPRAGLWPGLSLRHLRRRTYSLYGSPNTPGFLGIAIGLAAKVSPIQCGPLYRFSFPAEAPMCAPQRTLKGRCSIQLSYGRKLLFPARDQVRDRDPH